MTSTGFVGTRANDESKEEFDYSDIHAKLLATYKSGKTKSIEFRKKQLSQFMLMLAENLEEWVAAIKTDLGRHRHMALFLGPAFALGAIQDLIDHLDEWSAKRVVEHDPAFIGPKGKAYHLPQPKGVCLNISAWNFPVAITVPITVAMIAAGNCVIVKPSEIAPSVAALYAKYMPKYLDPDAYACVCGGVPETTALLKLRYNHIAYTGNGFVGKIVMAAAAKHLTPCTLELGGKSPVIIGKGANLSSAVTRLLGAKGVNNGQLCVSPDYVLLHESHEAAFYEAVTAELAKMYPDGSENSDSLAKIVNQRHWDRIAGLLADQPAENIFVGGVNKANRDTKVFPITIVKNPAPESKILKEEIFGPLITIQTIASTEQAMDYINDRDEPLAMYIFDDDEAEVEKILYGTTSGMTCVNDAVAQAFNKTLKFGGIGASGMGGYYGKTGFDEFSHMRSVCERTSDLADDPIHGLRFPPYSAESAKIIENIALYGNPAGPPPADACMEEVYDFIVVGAGGSGAVVASRLSEDPAVRVLLLEAGGTPPPESVIPAAAGALQTPEAAFQFRDSGSPGAGLGFVDQEVKLPCGKMLGGSTSINFMAYVRGHPGDYDAWAAGGATGWGWDDVLPLFKKSECLAPAPDDASRKPKRSEHGTDGPWSISYRDEGAVPYAATFVEQCHKRGYEIGDYNSTDRNSSKGVVGAHQFSIKKGQRSSTYTSFLQQAESRPNLEIITNATANKVVIQDGVAKGVEFVTSSGTAIAKASKEVVLSCGAYQSPQVLLRSGVGPKSELEAMKIDCLVDSPHVGKHLKDHLFLFIPFACENSTALGDLMASLGMTEDKSKLNDYLATGTGIPATALYEASVFYNTGLNPAKQHTHDAQISAMATTLNPDFFAVSQGIKDFAEHFDMATLFDLENAGAVLVATLVQPESEGQVLLRNTDVQAAPVIEHNYLKEDIDVKTFVAICKEAAAIKDMIGTKTKVGDILVPKNLASKHGTDLSSDALWEDWIRHYASTIYHPTSTCRIGDVVDPTCKVKGVGGLRVADASIMPNVISGNTQAPCIMIGEKVAEMIASEHGVKLAETKAAKIYYHPILGRANALFRMFEAANIKADLEGDMSNLLASRGAASKNFAPPVVEIDGVFVSQSQACTAFVGEKCGFDKGLDSCVAMQYMLDITDLGAEMGTAKGKGADAFKAFWAEDGRGNKFLTMIEAQIQGPFYTGDGMHYVDFFLFQSWESMLLVCLGKCPAILDGLKAKFPKIIGVYNGIKNLAFTKANDPVLPPTMIATDEWAATIN